MTLEHAITLESEEGLKELLDFLRQTGIHFSSENEGRVIKRLRIVAEMNGFKNYFELLTLLNVDSQTRINLFNWLEKGKAYNETENSFVPLVKRYKNQEKYIDASKKKKNIVSKININKWEKSQTGIEKEEIWSESEKDLKELLNFFRRKKVNFASKDEVRIIKRLRLITKRLGLKSFLELLNLLNIDPQTLEGVLSWLEKGKVYNEEVNSFTPLIRRKNILKDLFHKKKQELRGKKRNKEGVF